MGDFYLAWAYTEEDEQDLPLVVNDYPIVNGCPTRKLDPFFHLDAGLTEAQRQELLEVIALHHEPEPDSGWSLHLVDASQLDARCRLAFLAIYDSAAESEAATLAASAQNRLLGKKSKGQVKPDKEALALAELARHPYWTHKQVADAIGVTVRQVQRYPAYKKARAAIKTPRELPRGQKIQGDVEAYDER